MDSHLSGFSWLAGVATLATIQLHEQVSDKYPFQVLYEISDTYIELHTIQPTGTHSYLASPTLILRQ